MWVLHKMGKTPPPVCSCRLVPEAALCPLGPWPCPWPTPHSLCDLLRDRVLHLQARVDLDEVVLAVLVHQELHRTRVLVAHLRGSRVSRAAAAGAPQGRGSPTRSAPQRNRLQQPCLS